MNRSTVGRRETFKKYQGYHMRHRDLSMDEICRAREGFQLQQHQRFLKDWTSENDWQHLLLFHQIGSGKTCSAITIAEASEKQVILIMPAGLITNFTDELMSPCANGRYISERDAERYKRGHDKKEIFKAFEASYKQKYTIFSIDIFRNEALKHKADIGQYLHDFCADKLVIFDEVQHLVNTNYEQEFVAEILATGRYPAKVPTTVDGIHAILMRLLTFFAPPTTQFLMLSATPVFDNLQQFRQLVQIMNPRDRILEMENVKDMVPFVRNKISYFPKINENAYPKVVIVEHPVTISECQDVAMAIAQAAKPGEDEITEAFLSEQRQISLVCPKDYREEPLSLRSEEGLRMYAPKIIECMAHLGAHGKHMVYFNFIEKGVDVLVNALREGDDGWRKYDPDHPKHGRDYKRFITWIGDMTDKDRRVIKEVLNDPSNADGRIIKLIVGSPAMKEGISFKHVQHVHMLDMVWNVSAMDQIEGRAIRYCSHADIPPGEGPDDETRLYRRVKIHRYLLVPRPGGQVGRTVDQLMKKIIQEKEEGSSAAVKILKKVAIDHYLFRELERGDHSPMPAGYSPGNSPVEHEDRGFNGTRKVDKDNPCKPDKMRKGTCKEGYKDVEKMDEKGPIHCCRKTRKRRSSSSSSIIDLIEPSPRPKPHKRPRPPSPRPPSPRPPSPRPPNPRPGPSVMRADNFVDLSNDYAELRRLKQPAKRPETIVID